MRPRSSAERALIAAARVAHHLRVEVEDPDRVWRDLTTLGGVDWVTGAEWGESVDQPMGNATVTLRREVSVPQPRSVAPLVTASPLNRNGLNAYAPLLNAGRNLRISTAVTAPGATPAVGDWKRMFVGRIDRVSWGTPEVTLTCRDLGAWLQLAYIDTERTYATSGPLPVETVMQQVIADNQVFGNPTLVTPTSPGWMLNNTAMKPQERKNVLEALQQDYALSIGWLCRYRFDAAGESRLTFYEPGRARSTVDDTFGPTEYRDVTSLEISDEEVRNFFFGRWFDGAGAPRSIIDFNPASRAAYGTQFMEIALPPGDLIDTDAEMTALITAAKLDLGEPPVTQELETLYYWPVQLHDRYTFLGNGDHYDQALTLAVVGYRHRHREGEGWTTLSCRANVAGAYTAWSRRFDPQRPAEPAAAECRVAVVSTATQTTITASTNPAGGRVRYLGGAGLPATGPAVDVDAPDGQSWVFTRPPFAGGTLAARFRATVGTATADTTVAIEEQGRDTVALLLRLRTVSEDAAGVVVRVTASAPFAARDAIVTLVQARGTTVRAQTAAGAVLLEGNQRSLTVSTQDGFEGTVVGFVAPTTRDYWIEKPATGSAAARVSVRVDATGAVSGSDAIDVAPRLVENAGGGTAQTFLRGDGTWAGIQAADLPAQAARRDVAQTFAGTQTFATVAANVLIAGVDPGGTEPLRVGGAGRVVNSLTVQSAAEASLQLAGPTRTIYWFNGPTAFGAYDATGDRPYVVVPHLTRVWSFPAGVTAGGAVEGIQGFRIRDTGTTNPGPGGYPSQALSLDLKEGNVIGIVGVAFASVLTVKPWSDSSRGAAHQLAFCSDGRVRYRYQVNAGDWGPWRFLVQTLADGVVQAQNFRLGATPTGAS